MLNVFNSFLSRLGKSISILARFTTRRELMSNFTLKIVEIFPSTSKEIYDDVVVSFIFKSIISLQLCRKHSSQQWL